MKKTLLTLLALCSLAMTQEKPRVFVTATGEGKPADLRRLAQNLEQTVNNSGGYIVIAKNKEAQDVVDKEVTSQMNKDVRDDHITKAGKKYGAQYVFLVETYYDEDEDDYDIVARMIELETDISAAKMARLEQKKLKTPESREDIGRALAYQLLALDNKGIFLDENFKSDMEFLEKIRGLANFQAKGSFFFFFGIRVRIKLKDNGDNGCVINKGSEYECKMDINISGEQCDASVGTMLRDINAQVTGKGDNSEAAKRDAYNRLRNFRASCSLCKDGNFQQHLRTTLRKWEKGEQ
jgi:hypothetical protein